LITRSLQGLGLGAEWVAGSLLIAEVAAARNRGRAGGFVQSAWAVGWGAAALASTAAFLFLSPEFAWRALFILGALPAGLVFWIRRSVPESRHFWSFDRKRKTRSPFAIFAPEFRSTTFRASVLAFGVQAGYYSIAVWLPTFLQDEKGLSILASGGYVAVVILGSLAGYVTSAYANDWLGRRLTVIVFALGSLLTASIYMAAPVSAPVTLLLGFPLGFFACGIYAGLGPWLAELFPTEVRGSAQGFCYNFARGTAALFPVLVGAGSSIIGLGATVGIMAGCAYAMVILAGLALPETIGAALRSATDSEDPVTP
jgi:MFS family permease